MQLVPVFVDQNYETSRKAVVREVLLCDLPTDSFQDFDAYRLPFVNSILSPADPAVVRTHEVVDD